MLSFWKKHAQQRLPQFLWHRRYFGKCESLESSPVKMSQAFHDPLICFNFLHFHWKVSTFKTPEMCLYLDSDVSAGCFTIIFVGSYHYFKLFSCWILFCENVPGIPWPFNQLSLHVGTGNTFKMHLYFDSDVWGRCLTIILDLCFGYFGLFVGSFPYFKFLTKINSKVRRK